MKKIVLIAALFVSQQALAVDLECKPDDVTEQQGGLPYRPWNYFQISMEQEKSQHWELEFDDRRRPSALREYPRLQIKVRDYTLGLGVKYNTYTNKPYTYVSLDRENLSFVRSRLHYQCEVIENLEEVLTKRKEEIDKLNEEIRLERIERLKRNKI